MVLAQYSYVGFLIVSAAVTAGIGVYAFRRRDARSAKSVIALMTVSTWWTAFYAIVVATSDLVVKDFWFRIMYMGVIPVPTVFLIFTFQFAGCGRWVTPRTIALLSIEPLVMAVLVWIQPEHGVLAGAFDTHFVRAFDPSASGQFSIGYGFQIQSAYALFLAAISYVFLAWGVLRAPSFYRKQSAILFAGSFAVIGLNIFSIAYALPHYRIDVTWFGFLVLGLLMAYSLRGQGLLDLLPVARHEVVEAMPDGVVVVDVHHRAIDINPAAKQMLRIDTAVRLGASVLVFFPAWRDLLGQQKTDAAFSREIQLGQNQDPAEYISVQATPLRDKRNTLNGWIVVLRDITRIKTVEAELRAQLENNEALRRTLQEQAIRDGLTGLYNRRFLEDSLARELERAARADAPLTVCLLDLDGFKAINDTYGHGVGDQVLKELAAVLKSQTRRADVACRYGGEEFVILMPGTALHTGLERADALRCRFQSQTVMTQDGDTIRPCFSAGVACFPAHGDTAWALLHAADQALYAAKDSGRNRVLAAELALAPAALTSTA